MKNVGCSEFRLRDSGYRCLTKYFLLDSFYLILFTWLFLLFSYLPVTFHKKEKPISYITKLHGKNFISKESDKKIQESGR